MVSMSGQTFRAIEISVREFNGHGLKVDKYRIFVESSPQKIVVSFDDPDRPRTQLGSGPNMVGFTVELDSDTLEVTDRSFVK
jgi:hypothetical protein